MLITPSTAKEHVFRILQVEDEWQRFAWPLPNMVQVKERDFWSWRCSYSFKAEVNPVTSIKHTDGTRRDLLLYIVDHSNMIDGGFVVLVDRTWNDAKPIEYYSFGLCAHSFKEKNVGHCLHQYTCEHCKKSYTVDSSG